MLRATAQTLVLVMLLGSGRLLACGWECLDELAAPEVASCHEDSESDREGLPPVVLAKAGEVAHACLPGVVEPRVTMAKPGAPLMTSAPMLTAVVFMIPPAASRASSRRSAHARTAPPRSPAPSVLRI